MSSPAHAPESTDPVSYETHREEGAKTYKNCDYAYQAKNIIYYVFPPPYPLSRLELYKTSLSHLLSCFFFYLQIFHAFLKHKLEVRDAHALSRGPEIRLAFSNVGNLWRRKSV
jgi:hypothetical protein